MEPKLREFYLEVKKKGRFLPSPTRRWRFCDKMRDFKT
jgi:hypothetical protein